MSAPLKLFRHITCPNGDACAVDRCLFRHARDDVPFPISSESSESSETAVAEVHSQDGSRKRARESDGEGDSDRDRDRDSSGNANEYGSRSSASDAYDPAARLVVTAATFASKEPPLLTSAGRELPPVPSLLREISPPPQPLLKRRAAESAAVQSPSSPASASSGVADLLMIKAVAPSQQEVPSSTLEPAPLPKQAAPSSTPVTAAPSQKAAPAPAPRKPETLNPRHLGKAPAIHETRYKLVNLLHNELVRLNSELESVGSGEGTVQDKRLLLSDQELIWLALDIEEHCAVSKPSIYSNTIKHRIMNFRRMTLAQWVKERTDMYEKDLRKQQRAEQHQKLQVLQHGLKLVTGTDSKASLSSGMRGGDGSLVSTAADGKASFKPHPPKPIDTGLTPPQELLILRSKLLTPIGTLANHGYVPTVPSAGDMQRARDAEDVSKGWEVCDRCTTRFQVFPGRREEDGALTSGGTCTYHPGRAVFPPRTPVGHFGSSTSTNLKRFRCCGQAIGDSRGCATALSHVFKTSDPKRLALLWNFVDTPPAAANVPPDRSVCFDCEMCYTVHGMELVRLTATAWPTGDMLLDVLVRPFGEIIDLNSRYSGVWPDDIANAQPWTDLMMATQSPEPTHTEPTQTTIEAKTTNPSDPATPDPNPTASPRRLPIVPSPRAARDLFFRLIGPDTPLIGHGLENDLNCLRIVHTTLVDTILLFPHPKGLPVRYSLKALVESYLDRQIQVELPAISAEGGQHNNTPRGHDSAEDARAAGDLVRWKVKQIWEFNRSHGCKFVDGQLVVPWGTSAPPTLPSTALERGARGGLRLSDWFLEAVPATGTAPAVKTEDAPGQHA